MIMKNGFIKVKLTSLTSIQVMIFSSMTRSENLYFSLKKEGEDSVFLNVKRSSGTNAINLFDLDLPTKYEFGKNYSLSVSDFAAQPIDVSDAIYFDEFDNLFNYDKDDLGIIYSKNETKFALWAPLATNVALHIFKDGKDEYYKMIRTEKGVYRLTLKGDYLNVLYRYVVTNNGVTEEANDPYAKGTNANSLFSAVINIDEIKNIKTISPKTVIKNYTDAIIYEVSVRDFTEQNDGATDILNKGKYLGFIEENRKTSLGNPAGIDFLKYIGVTHVQLNPVIDFGSVDDLDTDKKYNWGYDPISMFALEGSYSLEPDNPSTRLKEFKQMVNGLHKNDIRVILDVVYNHTYNHIASCYEKILPQYFFRRKNDGHLSNASGCGNDISTERFMVRKMIIDSLKYFTEVFDVDGFRFDLMGLIDIDTISKGIKECKKIKNDLMFYGEGWNMGNLPFEQKTIIENSYKLPNVAFFNDMYRDIVKGSTFDKYSQGFVTGDSSYIYGFKFVFLGSAVEYNYTPRFISANQSINYIECHDNNTLFDKLLFTNPDENLNEHLQRIKLMNSLLLLSFGVPFMHMGQIIGQTKKGNNNTYNVLDINKMDWHLVDERFHMIKYIKDLVYIRKNMEPLHLSSPKDIAKVIDYTESNGALIIEIKNKNGDYTNYKIVVNATDNVVSFDLDDEYRIIFGAAGLLKEGILIHHLFIGPRTICILSREK